jgi:limonene-1,2-epoxide hydrolase
VYAGTRQPLAHPDPRVTHLTLDVTNAGQIQAAVESVESLDIVINNAGLALYVDLSDRAALEQSLAVNLFGPYDVTQAFLPLLSESRGASRTQQATLLALGDSELREMVKRFADAWEHNDVDAVVAMLADDARMTMPPWPSWYSGRDAVATFLRGWPLSARKRWRLLRTGANGQPAIAGYLLDEQTGAFEAETIIVLTFHDAQIEEITAFRLPELFPLFGLPEQLPMREN